MFLFSNLNIENYLIYYWHSYLLFQPTLGLTNTSVSQTDGVITCTFMRTLSESSDDKYFDLNNDYILMLVVGLSNLEEG